MDKELLEQLKSKDGPFSGITTYCTAYIPISDLRILVSEVVEFLSRNNLLSINIFRVWDWLEHDGYLPNKELITKEFIFELLKDDETFYSNRSGDTYVNLGLYDKNFNWYLRIYIIDEFDLNEDQDKSGSFSISMNSDNSKMLNESLNFKKVSRISEMNSYDYFKSVIV